jgi:hypothetical protein
MVVGIDKFREHFAGHENEYVLIGGAACDLVFAEAGLNFRATRDFDVVLCVEIVRPEFAQALRGFIDAGGYEARERSDGNKEFYRFQKPRDRSYPYMIELFSSRSQGLKLPEDFRLTKVAVDQGILSLSAILLDEHYYAVLQDHKVVLDGVSILDEKVLIPFKAKAFLDLTKRRADGEDVDTDDIKKHRNDVYRLAQLLTAETFVALPDAIRADLNLYLSAVDGDAAFDPNAFGVRMSKQEGADLLRTVYKL